MIKVLISVNLIPNNHILAVVRMSEEAYNYFSCLNGYTINVDNMDEEKLEAYYELESRLGLCSIESCTSPTQVKVHKVWQDCKLEKGHSNIEGVQKLISTGFYL